MGRVDGEACQRTTTSRPGGDSSNNNYNNGEMGN